MKAKKALLALLLWACLLSGCTAGPGGTFFAGFREVEKLQVIQTMGFDGQPGRRVVSVSSGRGGEEESTMLLAAEGASIPRAEQKLQDWSAQEELFFAHVRYAVVGEEAARAGVLEIMDHFERDAQTRMDLPLFIVQGGTALELVTGFGGDSFEITEALSSIERDAEQFGAPKCFTLLDAARCFARGEPALCCAVQCRETEGNVFPAGEGQIAMECGYAVLRDGLLLGFLDDETARGVNLLRGEPGADSAALTVDGRLYTVSLTGGKTEVVPAQGPDGELTLRVRLDYRAGLKEVAPDAGQGPPDRAALDAALAQWLLLRAETALQAAKALDADFLDLGRRVRRKAPALWSEPAGGGLPDGLRWELEAVGRVERSYGLSGLTDGAGEGARDA